VVLFVSIKEVLLILKVNFLFMIRIILSTVLFLCTTGIVSTQVISYQEHKELGDVHWNRDYDKGLAQSTKENKPMLILFQEVPGCATCRNYGSNVLSHPLIVETIENYFIPVTIFNNKRGKDLEILNKYNEPTWNNPVVRIVDNKGEDIVKRVNGNYSEIGLIDAMMTGIIKSGNLVPEYLNILYQELSKDQNECYLSMYCFWTGEKEIAKIPGVVTTQAGFMNGKEVVKVSFNENETNAKKIKKQADKKNCGDNLYLKNNAYRVDGESKYYLRHSKLQYVPMTIAQATKINSALGERSDPLEFLSPQQLRWYHEIEDKKNTKGLKNYIEKDIRVSWADYKKTTD